MATDLEKIAAIQDLMEKEAFVGSIAGAVGRAAWRGAKGLGGVVARNPGKFLGGTAMSVAFGAPDVVRAMRQSSERTIQSRAMAQLQNTEPTM